MALGLIRDYRIDSDGLSFKTATVDDDDVGPPLPCSAIRLSLPMYVAPVVQWGLQAASSRLTAGGLHVLSCLLVLLQRHSHTLRHSKIILSWE